MIVVCTDVKDIETRHGNVVRECTGNSPRDPTHALSVGVRGTSEWRDCVSYVHNETEHGLTLS